MGSARSVCLARAFPACPETRRQPVPEGESDANESAEVASVKLVREMKAWSAIELSVRDEGPITSRRMARRPILRITITILRPSMVNG